MGIGAVNQPVFIRTLPEGVIMTITNVELVVPSTEGTNWWPTFSGNKRTLAKNTSQEEKNKMFPFTVSPNVNDGRIGEIGLSTLNVTDSGEGPSVKIEFTFTGNTPINGAQYPVDQKGNITVSTTEWGNFWGLFTLKPYSRPDKTIVAYSINGSAIGTASNTNDALQSPRGIELLTAVAPNTAEFGFKSQVMDDGWKTAFSWALKGIFWGHEAAVGWVFGAVGLTAGAVATAAWEGLRNMK